MRGLVISMRGLVIGGVYRHFKGGKYRVIAISKPVDGNTFIATPYLGAEHIKAKYTEAEDLYLASKLNLGKQRIHMYDNDVNACLETELVLYHPIDDEETVYARPLDMFLSKVDREKYPNAKQEYRLELCLEDVVESEEIEIRCEACNEVIEYTESHVEVIAKYNYYNIDRKNEEDTIRMCIECFDALGEGK